MLTDRFEIFIRPCLVSFIKVEKIITIKDNAHSTLVYNNLFLKGGIGDPGRPGNPGVQGPEGEPGLYDPSLDEISEGAEGPQGPIGK